MAETTETKATVAKGLSVRTFGGEIDKTPEEKDKTKKTIVKFNYDRIVFPWSRTGTDIEDKVVTGSVPTLAEVLAYINKLGFTTEFVLDSENNPKASCVVEFLVDGLNSYFNQTARAKALNTKEAILEKAIAMFVKTGMSRSEALEFLKSGKV